MEIIKTYKTISILVSLIVAFGIITVFVKAFDIGGNKTTPQVKITPTPTPVLNPFINPEILNIPSSYMGYVVTKVPEGEASLGKNALVYKNKIISLEGTEWVVRKSKVSDFEYMQVKAYIDSLIQQQVVKLGWKSKGEINGSLLAFNAPNVGFVQVAQEHMQALIVKENKDASGSVEIRIFLSKIKDLSGLI